MLLFIDPNDHQNLSKWLVLGSVDLTSCTGSTTIVELPEEEEKVSLDVPRIFDINFQIENGTSQKAEINSVSYSEKYKFVSYFQGILVWLFVFT